MEALKGAKPFGLRRSAAGSEDERSWRFQAGLGDFQFAVLHPDIALALLREPLQLSGTGEGAYAGRLLGLQITWRTLSAPSENPTRGHWSNEIKASMRFPPFRAAWQLDVSAQPDGQGLLVSARLQPSSRPLMVRPSWSLWREALHALAYNLGRAAERLSHDSPEALLHSLPLPEQQEALREHLASRPSTPHSAVALEGSRFAALLSILEAGDRTLIRFQTNVPRPRRSQETLCVSSEAGAELTASFDLLAQAGSAFSTLRGSDERRALGRDLHERLIQLGRQLYTLYIPKGAHGYLTSLLEAHPQGPLRMEIEGEARALPWELLHNGEDFLTLLLPLARTPVQTAEAQLPVWSVRRVLLVAPESALGEALAETQAIYGVLTRELALHVEVLAGRAASKDALVQALRGGAYDALHYSGHSLHDPERTGASHLILNEGRKLRADELRRLAQESGLKLVFLNSCASGSTTGFSNASLAGLADAFVQDGVPCVIGMRWPVSDRGAHTLALTFYQALAETGNPAEALRQARLTVGTTLDWEDPAWAAPLLYLT